jgi:RimJ/RimL family protein N-acetyltransferase
MNPLLIDLPEQLETERLIIRWPRPGAGAAMNAAIRESIEELRPWMEWAQAIPTLEESEAYARAAWSKVIARTELPMHLYRKDTQLLVGASGLVRLNWEVPRFEIGYWCRTSCLRMGFISEAVQAITAFAFGTLRANRVELRCDERNERSRRVAARTGYACEGRLVNECRDPRGGLRTTLVFARTTATAPA